MLTATRIRVLRIITRLNIGGPAHHVATLANLAPDTFETRVIHGVVGDDEADASDTLVLALGDRTVVPQLGRRLSALKDCAALFLLVRELFRFSPRILHTHTAKAGALGRLAGFIHNVIRPWRRIRTVHTFHGHVFDGYFGRWRSMAVRWIERRLSRITDRIIVISERQQFDIVERFDIAPARKTRVVPIGLNLKQYLDATPMRDGLRDELGVSVDTFLAGIIGRLAPVKNHELFLRAANHFLRQDHRPCLFVVVGDGGQLASLRALAETLDIRKAVRFLGWRADMARIYQVLDVVTSTSLNEGTPVTLIEAMASGRAIVATDVGGVGDVVTDGETGILLRSRETGELADAWLTLATSPSLRRRIGNAARESVAQRFSKERLLFDMEQIYRDVLETDTGA